MNAMFFLDIVIRESGNEGINQIYAELLLVDDGIKNCINLDKKNSSVSVYGTFDPEVVEKILRIADATNEHSINLIKRPT